MSDVLKDLSAERAVLAGILRYGFNSYADICDIISDTSFTDDTNKVLFKCCKSILERDNNIVIDLPTIMAEANSQGFQAVIENRIEVQHIRAIFDFPINETNVRRMAAKIRKLEIGRQLKDVLRTSVVELNKITGDEKLAEILGLIESPIYEFSTMLTDGSNNDPKPLTNAQLYLQNIENNPRGMMGVSSGFHRFDSCIGGGFRPGTVNVLGARTKVGKTFICNNIGIHVAHKLKIPVLSLDTEMMEEDQYNRMLGIISGVPMSKIESGQYINNINEKERLYKAAKFLDDNNSEFTYLNISGREFEDILSIMRRWINKNVGKDEYGITKPCLIIYDYIKLLDSSNLTANLQEYQALGFLMTAMHNLAVRYKVPIFSTVQLNRDGIDEETTAVVSGSDRIIWLCSNFSIYKLKTTEEIAVDGIENGTRKLIPIAARHGPAMAFGDYICMKFHDTIGRVVEGKKRSELSKDNGQTNATLEIEGDQEIPFE